MQEGVGGMKRYICLSVGWIMALVLGAGSLSAQEASYNTTIHHLDSKLVGDRFIIDVHLPPTYGLSENHYPVLIVLDGDKSSGMARDIVDWLSWRREIPELVVVAISYGGAQREWWQKRSRDFTPSKDSGRIWGEWPLAGGADAFRGFIRDELVPLIDREYRVTSDRSLAGVSFGGLFAVHTLFTEPGLFRRYIIAGPALAWDEERIWDDEQRYLSNHNRLEAAVFTGVGALDQRVILEPWERFNTLIESRSYEGLKWVSFRFEGETHISSWPAILTRGLKVVFTEEGGR